MKDGKKRYRYPEIYGKWLRDRANGITTLNFHQYQLAKEKKTKEKK